ncbi:purine-nucleoside phosphorylase [Maledivibacter halophilus]|uniref:Purine nucleoside phosphorylase n=1 Tax=Maledivibacter halophilus TaxID=36842 RepID=A0A1T5LKS2_9FIRM|nr:purine-nucleoside phosphorylase [Maledivibacter halophilus]SKC76583.1 purine-nucleoside phosphorylase [Maledivibacter halophilus]
MKKMYDKIMESVEYIENKVDLNPKIGIILGSGLGNLINGMEDKKYINYNEIPNCPQTTVEGHEGRLVYGTINGVTVLAMQGRFHYYEGYTMKEVVYPVFVMKYLGVEKLIVTNSCGGINTSFKPGTLMIINDFINLFGDNPLIGINDKRFGPRFPDMTEPYKLDLIDKAKKTANKIGVEYTEGVYAGFMGPYYETAAEIRSIGGQGADAVGMSTVPETIAANYLGIDVLGISCITNMATGIQKQKHSHERVVEIANKASEDFCSWVTKIIEEIG